ncbi:glycosyl transferase [Clostridium carnis]|uniref:Glycosyl transferase n=1 Tax=Clostridium carnis TaxID=1530 RepID=A0ABY6SUY5_9CLOT|nr:glycosyltransferase [Clostridium carnis]VDG72436.1 glycosyl transferase [Clostridium carnis]
MKILILADTDLSIDARIRRHIFALKNEYELIITGIKKPEIEGNIEFIDCSKKKISNELLQKKRKILRERIAHKKYEEVYWNESYIIELYDNLKNKQFDLIISNDVSMLPLGVKLAKERKIKIISDMHEYAPRQFEDLEEWRSLLQKYIYYLCKTYLPKCDEIVTVAKGIAEEYAKEFNINVNNVITNAPQYTQLEVKETDFEDIKMVYHGAMNFSRHLERLIDIVEKLDERFTMIFHLITSNNNDDEYSKKLLNRIKNSDKCLLEEAVKPEEIVKTIHKYDIGIFFLEPVNFNYKYALPNKFFDFIQAKLAIAIGPSMEMKNYVEKYKCGIVSDDFTCESLINRLSKLTLEDIENYKNNSANLSKIENFENNSIILRNIVKNLLEN